MFFNNLFTNYLILSEMKKINVRKVSDILSDKQLKNVYGGYNGGNCQVLGCWESLSVYSTRYVHNGNCWNEGEANCPYGFLCQPCPF